MRKDLGQGLKDALGPQNNVDADIPKVLRCFIRSNTFFKFTIKTLTDDVIKSICDVITLI